MSAYIGSDGDGTRLWDITGHDNLLANVTWLTASEIQQYVSWSASTADIKFSNNSIYFSNLSNTEKSFNININNISKKYIGFYFSVSPSLDISTLALGPGDIQVIFTFQNINTITTFSHATGTSNDGTVGCIFDSKKEKNITANFKIRTAGSSYYCYIFLLDDLSIFSDVITTSDNKARNISKAYIGVPTEKTKDVPRQETTTTTKTISCTVNDANTASQYKKLSDLFTITNGSSYYFANDNTESTNNYSTYKSNNSGYSSTTASTTLTALHDFSALSFGYSYSGESNYDYVTLTVGGTTVESKASGSTTNKTWSGTLSKGQTIKITFTKDTSYDRYDDCGTIYNIQATYQATVTETTTVIDKVGTGEYANLARRVKAIYIGDPFTETARFVFAKAPEYIIDTDTSSTVLTQNRLAALAAPASGKIDVTNAAKIKYYYGTTIKDMDNDALQYCTSLDYLVLPVLDRFPRMIGDNVSLLNFSLFLPKCDRINISNFSGKILYAPRAFAATGLPDQPGLGPTSIVYLPSVTTFLIHSQAYSAIYFDTAAIDVLSDNKLRFPKIKTLVLRASDVCSLGSIKILENSLIANGKGYIYVPDNLVNLYKTAANWSTYANQIKSLSELPSIDTFIKELKP